jgi:hypothetical protein
MISASDSEASNVTSGELYEPSNLSSNSYDDKELNEINETTNGIPAHSNETNGTCEALNEINGTHEDSNEKNLLSEQLHEKNLTFQVQQNGA